VSWIPRIGAEFAGYRLDALLGHGGMSIVYRAEHQLLARKVALKLLAPQLGEDESFRERFARESRIAASLDHPNIIPIYEAAEAEGVFFIAMRYVEGADLRAMLKQGPIEPQRLISIIDQTANALAAAHSRDLVHRDVKPANILIDPGEARGEADHVYLSDFGVAKQMSVPGLTTTGMFVGTAEYAAPEQIEGKPLDGRADTYAMGCVVYECLTGNAVYDKDSEVALMYAHLLEPPPRISERRPDLPAELDDVLAKAMAKTRDDRYAGPKEFAAALRNVLAGVTSVAPASAPATIVASSGAPPTGGGTVAGAAAPGTALATSAGQPAGAVADGTPSFGAAAPPGGGDDGPASTEAGAPRPRRHTTPKSIELTSMRLLLGLLALFAIVAAAVIVAVVVSGGGSSNAVPTTSPGATTGAPALVGLDAVVPKSLLKYCKTVTPTNGARQTTTCTAPAGSATFWPDDWSFSLYPSTASVLKAYDALRTQAGIDKDFGRCDRTTWAGEGAWLHNPEPGAQPKPGGRRFCYFQGNIAVMVWTHEKLGQQSHIDMLSVARAAGSDHFNLYGWYSFWHHRVGKCLTSGCVARLP
jgi:serine/threonine-protein kinase